ncbi:hypothetical protein SEA_WHEEHEIM_1 [Streptomyces phage WheeHeim]|uniref:Uncharacterized protein n=1 Tax=Streptomyces phage WheeHeim TaxID=2500797 RepID=A0A411AXW7_9VIRU|nr:hypothetical protein KMD61_gp01 [Streptomyces phage WheeHeim]QAX92910.1 hypothetical protein SEA_WHEEHEIM_1 [Streptomyces phage WheeHeim]
MASGRSMKDKAMASMLKDKGIRRTTGQCPRCHKFAYTIANVNSLLLHLNWCQGSRAKVN